MRVESTQTQTAYRQLHNMILSGELREGYPLLEVELSERLNMSRTPVREALVRLRTDGLVDRVGKKGLYVKVLSKDEIKQTYEYIEGVESMISYLLAGSINAKGTKALERNILRMERALAEKDVDAWIEADSEFHAVMLEYCQNTYLVREMKKANVIVRRVRNEIVRYSLEKEPSMKDHRALFEAIRDGDRERARSLTQEHIKRVRERLMIIL